MNIDMAQKRDGGRVSPLAHHQSPVKWKGGGLLYILGGFIRIYRHSGLWQIQKWHFVFVSAFRMYYVWVGSCQLTAKAKLQFVQFPLSTPTLKTAMPKKKKKICEVDLLDK